MTHLLHPKANEVLAYIKEKQIPEGDSVCVGKDTCDPMSIEEMKRLQVVAWAMYSVHICLHIMDRDRYNAFVAKYPRTLAVEDDPEADIEPMSGWFI
jgi:N12 class adenine-specific DNA methylase